MPRSPLAVPLGLAPDGSLVYPSEADPTQPYTCAGCGGALVLRRSQVRRSHFAHRSGKGCSAESVLHRAAKGLVIRVVNEWRAGTGPRPCVDRPCTTWSCDGGVVQDLPDDITHAEPEVRLPDGSVADVVLFRGEEAACVVEILATHEVDPEKAARMSLPWMELDADDVLDRPYWWVVVQDGLRPFVCPKCRARSAERREEVADVQAEAAQVAAKTRQALPASPPYHFAPHRCWRCGEQMLVFVWPGGGGHSAKKPPTPRPTTVRLCATEGYGAEYWANCCPACHSVQGDWYLRTGNQAYARVMALVAEEEGTGAGW